MKRIYFCFCTMFLVFYLVSFTSHAETYQAPNGNTYKYKYQVSWYQSRYYYLYSNVPFGRYTGNGSNSYGQYNIACVYDDKLVYDFDLRPGALNTIGGIVKYPNATNQTVFIPESIACVYLQNGNMPTNNDNLWAIDVNMPIGNSTYEGLYNDLISASINFDDLYYDPTIPTPEFIITMERPTPWQDVSTDTNFFDVTWNEYAGYYVQIGYKFSYPNGMKVGLVDGQTTFTPLTYAVSDYIDLWPLEEMHDAFYINSLVNGNSFELESAMIQGSDSWQTSVPIWANNFNNSAYTAARNKWNTKMRYCWPLYGLKFEIFERLFYIADGSVYVGAWKHWNNSYPSDYNEEIPSNYQVGSSMPGYSNISNNTEYQEQEYTENTIGNQTGINTNPAVIVNNLTPNYPDYPTVATYNHDNILLQFFTTAKQLPSSFSGFTSFLSASLTWIPSYIWDIIALGLLASITVMVIKIL